MPSVDKRLTGKGKDSAGDNSVDYVERGIFPDCGVPTGD